MNTADKNCGKYGGGEGGNSFKYNKLYLYQQLFDVKFQLDQIPKCPLLQWIKKCGHIKG